MYFVTYRDYTADRYLKGGNDYFKMPRLSPTPGNHKNFDTGPFNFDIEIGDESTPAHVYAVIFTEHVNPAELTVKINGSETRLRNDTGDGLSVFEVDPKAIKAGINQFHISKKGNLSKDQQLKDAALFFCRDMDDLEMRNLIAICK